MYSTREQTWEDTAMLGKMSEAHSCDISKNNEVTMATSGEVGYSTKQKLKGNLMYYVALKNSKLLFVV